MFVRLLCVLFGVFGVSVAAMAADFGSGKYEVYRKNNAGDTLHPYSYYLHAKEQTILLHGDIVVPIVIPPGNDFEITADITEANNAVTSSTYGADPGGGTGAAVPTLINVPGVDFSQPQIVDPAYDVEQSEFELLAEGQDYYLGDFDGDGLLDLLIISPGHNVADLNANIYITPDQFVMVNGGSSVMSIPAVEYTSIQGLLANELSVFGGTSFVVRDVDGDGRDELVAPGDYYVADTAFSFSSSGEVDTVDYLNSADVAAATLAGATQGSFRVTEQGGASYSIPISLPAGTSGVAPELSVNYSSHGGDGEIGKGWSLSGLSSISRCRQTLSQEGQALPISWSSSDRFCLGGAKLVLIEGDGYGADGAIYKTEVDSQVFVTSHGDTNGEPDYFTAETKDGAVTYYGLIADLGDGSNSKQQNSAGKTLAWAQSVFVDSVGNKINYEYSQESGDEFHIANILYAFGGSDTAHASVEFEYSSKKNTPTRYVAGYPFKGGKRLNRIVVKNMEPQSASAASLSEVRRFDFYYLKDKVTSPYISNRLAAVQECVDNQCLPASQFTWAENRGKNFSGHDRFRTNIIEDKSDLIQLLPMDMNGDGYMDFALVEDDEHHERFDTRVKYYIFNPETNELELGQYNDIGTVDAYGNNLDNLNFGDNQNELGEMFRLASIDYNADGRQDLALYRGKLNEWSVYLSIPQDDGTWRLAGKNERIPLELRVRNVVFADINSDGLTDMMSGGAVYFLQKDEAQGLSSSTPYHYVKANALEYLDSDGSVLTPDYECMPELLDSEGVGNVGITPAGDLNGDGRADILLMKNKWCNYDDYMQTTSTTYHAYAMIQLPSVGGVVRFEKFSDLEYPGRINLSSPLQNFTVQDFNGDGLSDIVKARTYGYSQNNIDYSLFLNNGLGFNDAIAISSYEDMDDISLQIVDMNSDGYPDLLWRDMALKEFKYNLWSPNANSFSTDSISLTGPIFNAFKYVGSASDLHYFFDVDGDLHTDLINFHGLTLDIYFNQVDGLNDLIVGIENGLGAATEITYESLIASDHYSKIEGVNADETRKETVFERVGANGTQQIAWESPTNAVDKDAFYSIINNPYATLDDDYSQSFSLAFTSPVFEYKAPLFLVTRIEGTAPAGHATVPGQVSVDSKSAIEYFYEQAKIRAAGRGFLGFKALTTIDWQSKIRTQTKYRQDWPFIGRPFETLTFSENDRLISESTNDWKIVNWSDSWVENMQQGAPATDLGPLLIYAAENIEKRYEANSIAVGDPEIDFRGPSYDPNADLCGQGAFCKPSAPTDDAVIQTVTTSQKYDAYGNPYEVIVQTSGKGITVEKITENDYDGDGSHLTLGEGSLVTFADGRSLSYRKLGRLTSTQVTTTKEAQSYERSSEFTYYEEGIHAGLLKSEVVEPDGDNEYRLETVHAYDSFGNENSVTQKFKQNALSLDGSINSNVEAVDISRTATSKYDNVGRHVLYTTNDLGQRSATVTARNKYGSPTIIDSAPNSQLKTYIEYDVLGREIRRSDDTGAWTETEYLSCEAVSPSCPASAATAVKTSGADGSQTLVYFDAVARKVREGKLAFHGEWSFVSQEYDASGRVIRVSEPHLNLQVSDYWTTNTYDVLGRTVLTVLPDGSTASTHYQGNTTTVTNDLGQVQRQIKNGLGQLVEAIDNNGGRLVYDYNYKDQMEEVVFYPPGVTTEDGVNSDGETTITTSLAYDALGRKRSMDDPDKGSWEYRYNALGELVWQRDGKGQVLMQAYDSLGRMVSRTDYDSSGEVEYHTTWYYDQLDDVGGIVDYAVGQLTAVVLSKNIAHIKCSDSSVQQCTRYEYEQYGRGKFTHLTVRENIDFADSANDPMHTYTSQVDYDRIGRPHRSYDALTGIVEDENNNLIVSGTETVFNDFGYVRTITDLHTGTVLKDVVAQNLRDQITQMQMGLITRTNGYSAATGRLTEQTGFVGIHAFTAQQQNYSWDTLGNLLSRHNQSQISLSSGYRDQRENFCYDNLNRLIKTYSGPDVEGYCDGVTEAAQDLRYDSKGNIVYKYDVGGYSYNQTAGAGPHAVTQITGVQGGTETFQYDGNGNVESSMGGPGNRILEYTTFDKPYFIERGNQRMEFKYGIDRGRYWRKSTNTNSSVSETTIYIGNIEKIIKHNGEVQWRRQVPGGVINYTTDDLGSGYGMTSADDVKVSHILNDHLGSVDVIVDANGSVDQSMSFDPWGHRRNIDTLANLSVTDLISFNRSFTKRGFTGHEMLDQVGLIHMNGRIFDARLARFMQADPFIQAATNTQSYNRYSYAWNNPLNAIDPSGFIHWNYVQKHGKRAVGAIMAAVMIYKCWGGCAAEAVAMYAAFTATVSGALNGADGESIIISAFSAAATAYIGGGDFNIDAAQKIITIAAIGGVTASLQGGSFGHGFAAAGFSAAFGGAFQGKTTGWWTAAKIGTAAIVGGTTSRMTGGKFANGAVTGAFLAAVSAAAEYLNRPKLYNMRTDRYERARSKDLKWMERTSQGVASCGQMCRPQLYDNSDFDGHRQAMLVIGIGAGLGTAVTCGASFGIVCVGAYVGASRMTYEGATGDDYVGEIVTEGAIWAGASPESATDMANTGTLMVDMGLGVVGGVNLLKQPLFMFNQPGIIAKPPLAAPLVQETAILGGTAIDVIHDAMVIEGRTN